MAKKKKKRRWLRRVLLLALAFALLPVVQVGCVAVINPPLTPLMVIRKIEGRFSEKYSGAIRYEWVEIERVPSAFLKSVIAVEDARFFEHAGIDWQEVGLARESAARRKTAPRGASTITMQCARSLFLWQGRSYLRKGLELGYTTLMEKLLSKRRILELYVNVVEMGDGVYGLEAAAHVYFQVKAGELDPSQCAVLAAMLPAPRSFDPAHPSPRLRARQRQARLRSRAVSLEKIGR